MQHIQALFMPNLVSYMALHTTCLINCPNNANRNRLRIAIHNVKTAVCSGTVTTSIQRHASHSLSYVL